MSLRDIVSHADLAIFPEIGLILFLIAFLGVALRVLRSGDAWDHAANLPLEEAPTGTPQGEAEEKLA